MIKPSPELLKLLVNQKMSLVKILKKANPSGLYEVGRPTYCPFHENYHTPAAVIYDDKDSQRLWCFSERKMYYVSDAINLLLNQNPYDIGLILWDRLTPLEQQQFVDSHSRSSFDVQVVEKAKVTKEFEEAKLKFRYGQTDCISLLKTYILDL